MRLAILEHGHRWTQKLVFRLIRHRLGHVPGPIKVLTYRGAWFGRRFSDCLQQGLRQASEWSLAECELFAAFVSKLNHCSY
ncbi:MAG: hypothetical protein EXR86_03885 [Gammaproteobacteria bacterium]|nr:hypothetical protein [Gammaproteobacteria bacterium]